jgi:hypothetical protein
MSNEPMTLSRAVALCATLLLAACTAMERPVAPTPLNSSQSSAGLGDITRSTMPAIMQVAGTIPSWILNPATLPPDRMGKNNCRFQFGQNIPEWDFHPDAGCWEHAGPDGWTRQQQYKLHVPNHPDCGDGPADVSPIRVCQAPGIANPCPINPTTGPLGCAICVRSLTCH